jgi:hypothetical protein
MVRRFFVACGRLTRPLLPREACATSAADSPEPPGTRRRKSLEAEQHLTGKSLMPTAMRLAIMQAIRIRTVRLICRPVPRLMVP